MDNCGVPAESVVLKRIVGHKNKTVTEHYTHKDITQLLAAIDKFKLLQWSKLKYVQNVNKEIIIIYYSFDYL